jgi:hypothetical protein
MYKSQGVFVAAMHSDLAFRLYKKVRFVYILSNDKSRITMTTQSGETIRLDIRLHVVKLVIPIITVCMYILTALNFVTRLNLHHVMMPFFEAFAMFDFKNKFT